MFEDFHREQLREMRRAESTHGEQLTETRRMERPTDSD
jgi:hypothetical protein